MTSSNNMVSAVTLSTEQLAHLRSVCGAKYVLTDTESLQHYGRDWTRTFPPAPSVVVLPANTVEVQTLVRYANSQQLAIVPSGGRTGLSGGACATNGEIVLCLDRLNNISDFNAINQTVCCGAGVITQQLQQHAEDNGLYYPVDFASAGSSQIGGNIATNAGGIKVIRYGMTRDWVAGLTVVTGAGDIVNLNNGLLKNNSGYDLRQLMIGSEGTLGIITEAIMQLTEQPPALSVMVFGVPEFESVMTVLQLARKSLNITAYEFFSDRAMEKVIAHHGLAAPFETKAPFYALLEFENTSEDTLDSALAMFEQGVEQEAILDGVISQSETQAQNLWSLREYITESIAPWVPYKNDLSVKVADVPEFLTAVDDVVSAHYPDFETIWFGHIGDGNLHLSILKPEALALDAFQTKCNSVSRDIFAQVERFGGSISAEHGVGLLKKPYLAYSRSDIEISLMKSLKQVFDPKGILNPAKIFDDA